ncbi:MAG: zinc-ribbon and DUF3426 domain-containing protein [Gammaproteobacteria bacterium]
MITRCPNCLTCFRITAEHLRPAHGQVQCGLCNQQFDAVEHLQEVDASETTDIEQSSAEPVTNEAAPTPENHAPDPEDTVPEWAESEEEEEQAPPSISPSKPEPLQIDDATLEDATAELRFNFDSSIHSSSRNVTAAPADADIPKATVRRSVEDVLLEDLPQIDIDREEVEAIRYYLREGTDLPRPSAWWGVLGALLLLALGAQIAWYQHDKIFEKFPQARAMWDHFCEGRACALPPRRDIASLHVLSRDVREHPQYHDALLVNATVVNEAAFPQPYPVVELTLFDQSGAPIGARRFDPSEYLDESIAVDAGMKPEQPVYIVLELAGMAEHAVSFEFKFL